MRSIRNLFRRFIITIRQEGVKVGLTAVYNFFANRYFDLKYRLFILYFNVFHVDLVLRRISGNKMYLLVNDTGLSRELLLHRSRERVQTSLVKQLLKSGMRVVDIGANLGYYALIEASIVGETGKVYAIEPIPINYEILCKNVQENNYQDIVETYCCALSDSCGTSKIGMTKQSNFSTMFLNKNEMSEYAEKDLELNIEKIMDVETVTLDKFLENKAPVDFIRMDVEGYEATIVKGMSGTLKNLRKGAKIFFEIHPITFKEPRAKVGEIIQNLIKSGFEVKYIVDSTGTKLLDFSTDSLLDIICGEREWAPGLFLEKTNDAV